jgi:hypothetical protein
VAFHWQNLVDLRENWSDPSLNFGQLVDFVKVEHWDQPEADFLARRSR